MTEPDTAKIKVENSRNMPDDGFVSIRLRGIDIRINQIRKSLATDAHGTTQIKRRKSHEKQLNDLFACIFQV